MNNEEVDEAIKLIKSEIERCKDFRVNLTSTYVPVNMLDTVLNYIEELEKREIWSTATINGLKKDFIPKEKIRDKIEEIQKQYEETLKTANFKEIETMNKTNFKGIMFEGQRKILKELLESEN